MPRRDSKLWEQARAAYIKTEPKKTKASTLRRRSFIPHRHANVDKLEAEIKELDARIRTLRQRRKEVILEMKVAKGGTVQPKRTLKLYALRLQGGMFYVGMASNVEKRLTQHKAGKGAKWTKLWPPIEVHEVRETSLSNQSDVALLEDEMTLEYAKMYGTAHVRGGGYCQTNPSWPLHLYDPTVAA